MKNRFLTATAALSVALAAMQPLPAIAQNNNRGNQDCTPGEGDCPPAERGRKNQGEREARPQRQERQQRQEQAEGQRETREQPAEEPQQRRRPVENTRSPGDDRPAEQPAEERAAEPEAETNDAERAANRERREERRRAQQQEEQAEGEARQSGDAEAAQEEERRVNRERRQADEQREADEQRADEGDAAEEDGEAAANRERREERLRAAEREEADAEANREAERRATQRQQNNDEAGEEDGEAAANRERREERLRRAEQEENERAEEANREDGQDETRDADRRRNPGRDGENRQADGEDRQDDRQNRRANREDREPSEEAVDRLNTLLANPDDVRRDRVEAASGERNNRDRGRLIERRVTERDSRSSDEEFRTRVNEEDDDDDDDGLSDLQKFGLLALGGLAVGALLNNGDEVVSNTGDRVVVQQADGTYTVLKDDDTLIRRPGSDVQTYTYDDGSTESVVLREDGSQIVTIRDASGRVLRRTRVDANGQELYLINDLNEYETVDVSTLPEPRPNLRLSTRDGSLREALERIESSETDRNFSLRQVRDYREVRDLAPSIDIEGINFNSGSSAIGEGEAEKLSDLGNAIADLIAERPNEIVLIEGHTDAVGSAASNLALSDRRAESVALALTEYFDVPPENLVVQGYGESDLVVDTETAARENRRATARIITPLLEQASNQ